MIKKIIWYKNFILYKSNIKINYSFYKTVSELKLNTFKHTHKKRNMNFLFLFRCYCQLFKKWLPLFTDCLINKCKVNIKLIDSNDQINYYASRRMS